MTLKIAALSLFFFHLFINSLIAQTASDAGKVPDIVEQEKYSLDSLDIYLMIGQSNMAGRAPIEQNDADSLDRVYLFNGSTWEKAANPLNKYSTVRKGMELQKLGLTSLNGDLNDPHFDSRSQRILGERYADIVLEILYNR